MAQSVGAALCELEHNGNSLIRYLLLSLQTIRLVSKHRPEIIYFQNPSIILAALLSTLKFLRIIRAKIVGDFHNAGVHPPKKLRFLVPWIVKNSDLIIVSNKYLEPTIRAFGGRPISIPDPLIELRQSRAPAQKGSFDVFFICSWASDEPISEVFQAAKLLVTVDPDVVISVTGKPKIEKAGWTQQIPENIKLTGFLSEAEFEKRLANCNLVIDLTTRDNCMVCGAYEATSAEVPMILSNNAPTKLHFRKGALYTDNSAENIAQLIQEAKNRHPQLMREIKELKLELLLKQKTTFQQLKTILSSS